MGLAGTIAAQLNDAVLHAINDYRKALRTIRHNRGRQGNDGGGSTHTYRSSAAYPVVIRKDGIHRNAIEQADAVACVAESHQRSALLQLGETGGWHDGAFRPG